MPSKDKGVKVANKRDKKTKGTAQAPEEADGVHPTHTAKVLVIGDASVGKIAFVRRIMTSQFDEAALRSPRLLGEPVQTSAIVELAPATIEIAPYLPNLNSPNLPMQEGQASPQLVGQEMSAPAPTDAILNNATKAILRADLVVVTPTPALRTITVHHYHDAAAAVFVYDPNKPSSFDHVIDYVDDVKQTMGKNVVITMLVAMPERSATAPQKADCENRGHGIPFGLDGGISTDGPDEQATTPWPTEGPDDSTVEDAKRRPITLQQGIALAEKHRAVFVDMQSVDNATIADLLRRLGASLMHLQRACEPIAVRDLRAQHVDREGKVKAGSSWNCCRTKG